MEVVVEAVHLNPPLLLAFQHIGMDQHRILMLFCHGILLVTQPVTLVYRSTSANGSYSKIGDSNYSSYSDNNVSIGKTYYYKVKASNSAGQSDYSNYISVTLEDTRKPGPVTYGNCTATNTSITLRWTIPTDPSYGKPTKIVLRLYDPTYKTWVDAQELSGTATSVTFSFGMWIDSDGYVKCGVIPYNDYGSGGGSAKVYDTKNKKWIN